MFERAGKSFQDAFDMEMLSFFEQYSFCKNAYDFSAIQQNPFMSCDLAIDSYKTLNRIDIKRREGLLRGNALFAFRH